MTHSITRLVAVATVLTGSVAFAQQNGSPQSPYAHSIDVHRSRTNRARIIVPAQHHPNVAVSRSLAAQPVHPHLVKIVLGDSISTYIDPAAQIDGKYTHLDENHTLKKAARMYNGLTGVTTNELNRLRNTAVAKPALGNRAFVVTGKPATIAVRMDAVEVIRAKHAPAPRIEVKPKRKSVPIPSVPKPNKSADGDEKIASVQAGGDEI